MAANQAVGKKSALDGIVNGAVILAAFLFFILNFLLLFLRGGCLPDLYIPVAGVAVLFLLYLGNTSKLGSLELDWKLKSILLFVVLAVCIALLFILWPSSYCAHMYDSGKNQMFVNSVS